MFQISDAPWIREAEYRGTDYVGEWYGFEETLEDDDDLEEEDDEYDD